MTLSSSSIIFLSFLYCKSEWKICLYFSLYPCLLYFSYHNNQASSSLLHWNCSQIHNNFTKSNTTVKSRPSTHWPSAVYSIVHHSSLPIFTLLDMWDVIILLSPNAISFASLLSSLPINLGTLELDPDVHSVGLLLWTQNSFIKLSTLFWYFNMYLNQKQILSKIGIYLPLWTLKGTPCV